MSRKRESNKLFTRIVRLQRVYSDFLLHREEIEKLRGENPEIERLFTAVGMADIDEAYQRVGRLRHCALENVWRHEHFDPHHVNVL